MLALDATHGGVTPADLTNIIARLTPYREHLARVAKDSTFSEPEASIALPEFATPVPIETEVPNAFDAQKLRYVVVVGIGGSNLGALAVYEAVVGRYDALRARTPKILFLDTVSTTALRVVESALLRCASAEEFVIFVISKSGTTTESVVNAEALHASLVVRFPDVRTRFVAITDEGSKLWQRAQELHMPTLAIPKMVGGRYSVFSNVGIAPLRAAGVDVEGLLDGARSAIRDCTAAGETNPAMVSAAHTFLHAQQGIRIHNTFVFDPDLESMGKWYRQLIGESIGKSHEVGITPIVSVGSTDLHSMAQLYLGGPRDKFTNIITRPAPDDDAVVPSQLVFSDLVENVEKKSFGGVMAAIVGGVTTAYTSARLPFLSFHMTDRSARSIGYSMQARMIEVLYLAKLFNVNAFDQPAVEMYKAETRELMRQ